MIETSTTSQPLRNLSLYPAELRGLRRFLRLLPMWPFRSSGTERSQAAQLGTPESQKQAQRTHDLSARVWGCNYNILSVEAGGQRLRIAGWNRLLPNEGDYLILANGDGTTRYAVHGIKPCWDPADMFFADLCFAPR